MYFENVQSDSFLAKQGESKPKSLNLHDFWKGLVPSKETLHTIAINSSEIAFPVTISDLEMRFPKLQNLTLGKKILWANEIGLFCRGLSELKQASVRELRFEDEKRLKEISEGMREIPEGLNMNLYLNVEGMKEKFLVDCLKKFVKEVEIKGSLGLYIKNVEVEDIKNYKEILWLALGKGCFQTLKMDMKSGGRPLFYIRGKQMIIVAKGLE